ncbi:MAG: GTP 3',8-cyclase MoaA [Desulfovibrio sp.]|jgi:cyclic pyranopterin phosphate synthase|nr:GTP 3',8-cyclase MoaA [Desulfovibrio sp.]
MLVDAHGRTVRYLRLSLTDRCNLRCVYCRSNARKCSIAHDDILRYEELLRVVDIAVSLGIGKVRLTGGEPFVRRDCAEFLARLRRRFPDIDLRVTSNGTLLREHVPLLKDIGIGGVNLSLDSFRRETFMRVTGRDMLPRVLESLDALLAAGIPVKLNAVALKGVNDGELEDFVHAARTMPVDVRFIEFMPMGSDTAWKPERFWSADDILADVGALATLVPEASRGDMDGPARMYGIVGGKGRIGVISAMSQHFCKSCNRLRLTSDGRLRTCLFSDREYRLRGLLRHGRIGDGHLRRLFGLLCVGKPVGADILQGRKGVAVSRKAMTGIGG